MFFERHRVVSDGQAARARLVVVMAATVVVLTVPGALPALAAPTFGGTDDASYTEQDPATLVAPNLTLTGGSAYGGQYIDFSITGVTTEETLALADDGSADTTLGVVSVVGSSIYLGNGSTADVIGSIDGTLDGSGGNDLRINFTSEFTNSGFETGDLSGWTALDQQIDLGVTEIAGCTTVDTSTYPAQTLNEDDNVPSTLGSLTTAAVTTTASEGTYAARLQSTGMTTLQGFDVVHGPAIYSSQFEAAAGDTIYFDWRAFAGSDNYHVFGYIIDESCNQTELLDATGPGTTSWATVPTVIPSSGTYRFVFVSGTFDASGGRAAGASLYIDNVQVYGTKATDAVVQAVARKLTYHNASDDPPATRTLTITAQSVSSGSGSGEITINITAEDDPPTLTTPSAVTYTNTMADETFTTETGTLSATDPESDPIGFSLDGGVADPGPDYTEHVVGTYGTLYLDGTDGDYQFVPDDAAINARTSDDTEQFTLTATANGLSDSAVFEVQVSVPASVPGTPVDLAATAGDGEVELSWDPPAWLGGSAITDYVVQWSDDGGTTWNTFGDGVSSSTGATVTGLSNGTDYLFQVAAVNSTGTSAFSATAGATPLGVQSPLSVTASDLTYGDSIALAIGGGSGGGAVTFSVVGGPCEISGTTLASTGAGDCVINAIKAGDGTYAAATAPNLTVTVSPKSLTVEDAEVTTKVYDGTSAATITGARLVGLIPGDDVVLANSTDGTFASPAVGSDVGVTTAMSLSGADAANYVLVQPDLSGDIVAAPVATPVMDDSESDLIFEAGDTLTVEVCNLEPGTEVVATLDPGGTDLGTWTVGPDGCVNAEVTLPDDTGSGDYQVLFAATDLAGSPTTVVQALEVSNPVVAALPYTGDGISRLLLLGLALVLVGWVPILAGRTSFRRPT